jgi:hypothetical protein
MGLANFIHRGREKSGSEIKESFILGNEAVGTAAPRG